MIRVIVADDHEVVRRGLKQILLDTKDITVSGEAGNGHELLAKISEKEHDLILLDISMPGPNGLDVLKQVKADYPRLQVLILSMHPEDQFAVRALRAGASGYLNKDSASEELVNAIRKVSKGGMYVSANLAEKLAFGLAGGTGQARHETLSDREFQVFRMLAGGKGIKDIADILCLSPKTVSTYRSRILEKMHVHSNEELIQYAIHHNLLK